MPQTASSFSLLSEPYNITDEHRAFYQENGFIKLKEVLSPEVLAYFNEAISQEVDRLNQMHLPMEERDTYGKAFLQIMNLWRQSETVRELVFSQRLAQIAADLMEVNGVRLYHDQALFKEPSGGHTPWHADQYYWPLASDKTTTVWIPLQATPKEMGPLEFSAKSHNLVQGRDLAISDDSEAQIDRLLSEGPYPHIIEPYDLGEVSYHAGWTYHRAGPNQSGEMRKVMTVIYMEDGIRLKSPQNPNQQLDWDTWCPGAEVGKIIRTEMNPVLY